MVATPWQVAIGAIVPLDTRTAPKQAKARLIHRRLRGISREQPGGDLGIADGQVLREGLPRSLRARALRKRWLALAIPLLGLGGLVAIAPPVPGVSTSRSASAGVSSPARSSFRYIPDSETYSLDLDPRRVSFELYEGWDREQDAYADAKALAFVSGPMYEGHDDAQGHQTTVPLGDLKLAGKIWRGTNRAAATQRAFLGIRHNGQVDFGYGALTPEREGLYDTFIGGLHSIYNDIEPPPASYKGAYSIGMGQQIRYFLPRIRVVYGLRADGHLEILMSRDGLTLEQTRALARQHGLRAAYLPDHASKSRLIVPGVKGFSPADANWISGGATSFVHVPYMLRLSERAIPLQGTLLASLTPRLSESACGNLLQCGHSLGAQLVDRAMAGFNRLMERGVVPVARLVWGRHGTAPSGRDASRSPLREPVITADPKPVRMRQERDLQARFDPPAERPLAVSVPAPEAPVLPPPKDGITAPRVAGEDPGQNPAPADAAAAEHPAEHENSGGSVTTSPHDPSPARVEAAAQVVPIPRGAAASAASIPPPAISPPPPIVPPPPLPAANPGTASAATP